MAWGTGNVGGGGGFGKSVIVVAAPDGTDSVTASYGGKTARGRFKDGKWILSNLAYGPGVQWEITATKGALISKVTKPMPEWSVLHIKMSYGILYDNGDEYYKIVPRAWPHSDKYNYKAHEPTIERFSDHMSVSLTLSSVNFDSGTVEIAEDVDVTNFKTLYVTTKLTQYPVGKDYGVGMFIGPRNAKTAINYSDGEIYPYYDSDLPDEPITSSIDVSNISGPKDIYIITRFYSRPGTIKYDLYKWWLE